MPFNKHYKAGSLIEVLVILAITAVSMVGIASVNNRTLIAIKDNETLDTANGIMVQALEVAKSPVRLPVTGLTGSGRYALDPNTNSLLKRPDGDADLSLVSECIPGSPYYVAINDADDTGRNICLQLVITQRARPLGGLNYYEVNSRVLFSLSNGPVLNQLVAYRRATDLN